MQSRSKGFTLIELLIIVAIITILSAIAVPNFLEAQVRSKISRARSDLRTYAVAINAYVVDHNRPPVGFVEPLPYLDPHRYLTYHMMTTPISYMTTLPLDPFNPTDKEESKYYHYHTFGYKLKTEYINAWTLKCDKAFTRGYSWVMYSVGPCRIDSFPMVEDMLSNPTDPNNIAAIYDPSNGSVSVGKLYVSNKGVLSCPM